MLDVGKVSECLGCVRDCTIWGGMRVSLSLGRDPSGGERPPGNCWSRIRGSHAAGVRPYRSLAPDNQAPQPSLSCLLQRLMRAMLLIYRHRLQGELTQTVCHCQTPLYMQIYKQYLSHTHTHTNLNLAQGQSAHLVKGRAREVQVRLDPDMPAHR